MNDKLQQLYDLYKQKGIINTTDFNTFASANDAQRQKLYDLGAQKGLFNTTDFNTFNTAWSGGKQEPVKKKESTDLGSKSEKPISGSSSRRFEGVTEEPISQKKVRTDDYIDQVQNAKTQPKQTKTKVANTFVPNAKEETVDVLTTDEANQMMAEDFGRKEFELYSKISDIDNNVFEQGETESVKYLNDKFKGSGFVFEETGVGNAVRIKSTLNDGFGTVVNEKVIELPTTLFPSMGAEKSKAAEQSMKEISDFMSQAFLKKSEKEFLNEEVKDYGQLVKLAATNPQKYGEQFLNQYDTEKWIDKQYMDLVIQGKTIKQEQQTLEQEIKAYQNSGVFNEETERLLRGRAANLQNQVEANTQKYNEMKDITANLPQAAAVYFQKKEKEGNLAGLVSGSLLGGLLNMEKMLITTAADVAPLVLPSTAMIPEVQQARLKAAGMTDAQIKDYTAKQLRKGIVKEALEGVDEFVSLGTTDEFIQSKDRGDLEKVVNFLGESVGTAISAGGNPALQSLAFFSQSYNAMEEEMNSPEFDGLTQMEKKLMSVPYGLVIGQLDKLGFNVATNVAKSPLLNKLITNTIARAFTSLPKNASVDVMEKAIEESVKATMAKTGLEIVGGALVEGTTEGTQSLAEYTMKNLYNNVIADKDVFQNVPDITTKEGLKTALSAAGEEFYYGALGGAIMGAGGTAVRSISEGFNQGEKEFDFFEKVINDPNLRSLIQTDIKTKITSGEITKAEAYEQIDAINKSVSILNSMPNDLSVESKREAYNLILERNKIEKDIEGKDPNLVAAQTERVKEINDKLKQLSYAVQEQGAGAVPVQSGAGVSQQMAQGKPQSETQGITGEGIGEEVKVEGTQTGQPQAKVAQKIVLSESQKQAYEKLSDEDKKVVDELINDESYEKSIGAQEITAEISLEDEINQSAISFEDSLNKALNISQPKETISEDTEVFTFGDSKYDINKANDIISKESLQPVDVSVDVLPKMSYSFISVDENTVKNADITKPVIIAKTKDGLLLIDGHHRVRKAIQENQPIKAFVLNENQTSEVTGQPIVQETVQAEVQKEIVPTDTPNDVSNFPLIKDKNGVKRYIPEAIAKKAYDYYNKNVYSGQSFETVKDRGGFSVDEMNRFYPNWINEIPEAKAQQPIKQEVNETIQERPIVSEQGTETGRGTERQVATGVQPTNKREGVKKSLEQLRDSGLLVSAQKGQNSMTNEEIDALMSLSDAMASVWAETTGNDNFYETFIDEVKAGDLEAIKEKGGILFQNVEIPQAPISRVSLAVFNLPEFKKMQGTNVALQNIKDMIKSRGKEIEKDIINRVLDFDKYQGVKRVDFDEFKNDVDLQVMKLEKIETTTYADYGMDNLGGNETYGVAETIVYNSPVDHGQKGHFSGDFISDKLKPRNWEVRELPGTNQYIAIDADVPTGLVGEQLMPYVGTAGNKQSVEKWIENRNRSSQNSELNVGLFGHIRGWYHESRNRYYLAEAQSDYFQKSKASDLYKNAIDKTQIRELTSKMLIDQNKKIIKQFEDETGYRTQIDFFPDTTKFSIYKDANLIYQVEEDNMYFTILDEKDAQENAVNFLQTALKRIYNFESPFSTNSSRSEGIELGKKIWMAENNKTEIPLEEDLKSEIISLEREIVKWKELRDNVRNIKTFDESEAKVEELRYKILSIQKEIDRIPSDTDLLDISNQSFRLKSRRIDDDMNAFAQELSREITKLEEKLIDEVKNSKEGDLILKQFVASQKVHEIRLFREAVKHAAEIGATELWFPSPYTLAIIEGYVSGDENIAPYEITSSRYTNELNPGDTIDYEGDEYVVIDSDRDSFKAAPRNYVNQYDINDYIDSEVDYFVYDALKSDFNSQFGDGVSQKDISKYQENEAYSFYVGKVLRNYAKQNPDQDIILWDDIEEVVVVDIRYDLYQQDPSDLFGGGIVYSDERDTYYVVDNSNWIQEFQQPNEYDDTDASNFESELSDTQKTVVNKYKEFNKYIQKTRPDAEFVEDGNGRPWLKTNITQDDLINPIIAFQNEGGRIKGAIDFQNDNKASVYIFDGADISTLAHEITGHLGRRVLEKLSEQDENFAKDYQAAMDWAGVFNGEWSVAADEKFARGFEKYLRDGKAPTAALKNVFEKLRSWLINIYRKIKGSSIDIELTPEITAVFDNLLRPQKEAKVEQLRGFDRMMSELDGIIEKSRKRRASEEKVFDNAMNYLQGSAVYTRATDVQREQMVRDLRKKFGKREKSAPSVKKLFGEVKDVKKITMPEYDLMVKQLMDFEKGAKTTLAKVTKASKELTAYVKEMVKKGHITTNQAVSVLRRFSATNLLDENSINNFVNYMRKVFNDAEYANKIANVRKKLPTAKKNIKTKIGVAKDLAPLMERVFAINPSIIPDDVFNKYSDAVMMMGERAAVLNLNEYNEIKENLIDVIDAVEMEAGLAEELIELFNDNKVIEEGKVNFTETLNKMFDEGLINEYERSLMKKYRSLFMEKKAKESKKAEKIEEAKKAVASATINSAELPTKDERDVAKKLAKLLKLKAYEMLTDDEIIQLSKVINNINNGFLTHKAEQLRERMSGLVKAKDLISPIQQVKVMFGELLKGKLKSKVTGDNVYTNIIKGNSAAFIDEVFGNFKERPFFNNIYEPIAQAIQRFNDENKIIRDKVDKLENDLLRHFSNNGREATKSKFKMMTYMLQVENDSNPDSKQVNPAQAFIEKTIQKIENGTTSMYTDRDAKELQIISDEYGKVVGKDDKGNDIIEIDSDKLYKSFSAEEKRILKGLRDINDSMTEKAEFTASVIRGNRINPINNYISLSTISDDTGNDQFSSIVDIRKMFDSTRQASTKAKSLIERTGKVSAINFDPFSSVRKSSSAVLMDYNMTPTIRESRIALKQLEKDVKEGVLDKSKREFVNALRDSFDLIVDNAIGNSMLQGTLEDSVIGELAKQGYRTMLASVDRAAGELLSNTMFVTFVAPVTWAKGTAYSKFLMSSDFFNLLNNVGSTQTSRIKPGNTLSNRMVDTSILQQATGLKGSSVKSEVRNRAEQIYNLTGKKVKNVAELTADTLISTPDKIMMQPLWMGTFASEFKKEAGVDVDVNKLAANDEAYMDKYADAIEKARREADDITVRAGSTDNGALAVLRNTISPEQKASRFWKWYKTFNGFMSKFLLFEYMTARSAVYQLFKEGRISKKEAVAELAAVTARMTMYSVVISMLGESVIDMAAGLLGYRDDEDDEEEKKKTLAQEVGQGLASTFTTMMFGRNFGNVARAPINMGVEYINQNYLDFLRNGEYDPYTDQLQYTIAPKEGSKDPFMDIALNTVGPISPFLKTGRFIGKYMYADEGKTDEKKERQRKEKWRVALEVPGSLGFVPFYNNIRKVQQDWIYGDLKKAEKITAENIGSKIQSAKSTMSSEISKAVKESASGSITNEEMNARIQEAQKLFEEKIKDYQKRLR